jgi:hypothetical protein
VKSKKRRIPWKRTWALTGAQDDAGESNVPGFFGSEKHGAVRTRPCFERGSVGDDGVRKEERGDGPKETADERLEWLCAIGRVESRRDLADVAGFEIAADPCCDCGGADEDLG